MFKGKARGKKEERGGEANQRRRKTVERREGCKLMQKVTRLRDVATCLVSDF